MGNCVDCEEVLSFAFSPPSWGECWHFAGHFLSAKGEAGSDRQFEVALDYQEAMMQGKPWREYESEKLRQSSDGLAETASVEQTVLAETVSAEAPVEEAAPVGAVAAEAPVEQAAPVETVAAEAPVEQAAPVETVAAEAPVEQAAPVETVAAEAPVEQAAPVETVAAEAPVEQAAPVEAVAAEAPETDDPNRLTTVAERTALLSETRPLVNVTDEILIQRLCSEFKLPAFDQLTYGQFKGHMDKVAQLKLKRQSA